MTKGKFGRMLSAAALFVGISGGVLPANAQTPARPNILVIMGDDIGLWNISAYNRGMMGYRTPNIDRIEVVKRGVRIREVNKLRMLAGLNVRHHSDLAARRLAH